MSTNKFSTKLQTLCGAKHSKTSYGVIKKMEVAQQEVVKKTQKKRKLKR
jgi:hypothetical protein